MSATKTGLNHQLLVHSANDKQFNPNKIIFSPPSGHVPQHDGVDNAPVYTLQNPITSPIFSPMVNNGFTGAQIQKTQPVKGVKNTFFSMFARKVAQ